MLVKDVLRSIWKHIEICRNDISLQRDRMKYKYLCKVTTNVETLDTIDDTLKMSNITWHDVDINHLDLNDKQVYEDIYRSGNTVGIFQMESIDAKRMCMEAKADNVEDIVVVNAANRPGTKDSFPVYCHNKLNPDSIKVLHPVLKEIFNKTQFVLLYQEQALSLFRYAGFPETEVDNARRAIGKKKEDVMRALESQFKNGVEEQGWTKEQADEIWKLILKQSSYCFNRGHKKCVSCHSDVV